MSWEFWEPNPENSSNPASAGLLGVSAVGFLRLALLAALRPYRAASFLLDLVIDVVAISR